MNEANINNSLLTEQYMPRPRIDKLFDQVTNCKLVYVIAGAGYGKTQAVHHFIKQHPEAVVRWVQLTENDNVPSRYWESLTYNIAFDNPDLAVKLRDLGFPETLARFKQFADILKTTEHHSQKTFLILDDFHLIHSEKALTFAERCAHLQIPGACVIIISRTEPKINALPLFSKGKAHIITEEELRFTDDEVADFLKQCNIPFLSRDLPKLIDATKGWALAIKLLSLVLKRTPNNLNHALSTMKQNVFKLLEMEAFEQFPERIQKNMVQLSLISDLPLTLLYEISGDASFLQNTPQLASFMWYDSFIGDYRIHPLYLEFLQSKHDLLSKEEEQDTYRWAAQWCNENQFYLDAMSYYAKSYQFERMLEIFQSYPFKLPFETCEYLLKILKSPELEYKQEPDVNLLFLKNKFIPFMLIGVGKYEEAGEWARKTILEWERSDAPYAPNMIAVSYSILAYVDIYNCIVTHQYHFPGYLKKAVEYRQSSSALPIEATGAFTVAHVRSFACLIGEGATPAEFEDFLQCTREAGLYISEMSHHIYYGYDDLVACELASFRNQPELAKNHAQQAILKAREKGQYSIALMAAGYLQRVAVQEGDYLLAKDILNNLRDYLDNPVFWNRQLLHDLFTGLFYIHIGLPRLAPSWLATDERDAASEVQIPVRELMVGAKYHIASKEYGRALTVLCNAYPREPQHRFLFGELTLSLLLAVARIHTGDTAGAMADFEKAYRLSFCGEFEMPFIELGKNLHPLTAAASKKPDGIVPKEWLKAIDRKASVYAKKTAFIRNSFKDASDADLLSKRELEVLNDLYHGLSREEMAENQYLSINTIKKILQSIYIKLDADNNIDAIRIAIEKRLI